MEGLGDLRRKDWRLASAPVTLKGTYRDFSTLRSGVNLNMMRTLVFAVCVGMGIAASPLAAAETWLQASVVLKHPNATIRPDKGGTTPSIFQIGWPATVKSTDGTWALLIGTPGFQRKSKIGWVRIYDLVNGNDDPISGTVSTYYTSKIEESPNRDTRATWYWLRGIYWDNNNDSPAAIKDYALAIYDLSGPVFANDKDCPLLCHLKKQTEPGTVPSDEPSIVLSPTDRSALLSDCYRRLGTALATVDPVCTYCCWKKCFLAAERFLAADESGNKPTAPRLYYEWGNAYVNALTALVGPGTTPSACSVPADLNKTQTAVKTACKELEQAVQGDPQFSDAHAALGDLKSTYATYLVSQTTAAAKPAAAKQSKDSPCDVLRSAIDEYRDAIQCDSGSNRAYLGRSQALQQLAYLIAHDAVATTAACPPEPSTSCESPTTNAKSTKSDTRSPANSKPPSKCDCCLIASTPDPTGCPPNDPPPERSICLLALANKTVKCQPTDPIAQAFAKVNNLLAAAAESAQSALSASAKGLSDNSSITQLATTLRDLAYLNDATPTVAFQYAASAYNLAANGASFAGKIEDGDSLDSLANSMKALYRCYLSEFKKKRKIPNPKKAMPKTPATATDEEAQAMIEAHAENDDMYSGAQYELNYSRMFGRPGYIFGRPHYTFGRRR